MKTLMTDLAEEGESFLGGVQCNVIATVTVILFFPWPASQTFGNIFSVSSATLMELPINP